MQTQKKVSVIINTYPREGRYSDLSRLLFSLQHQTYTRFETIVIENSDDAREVRDLLIKYYFTEFKIINDPKKKLSYLFNLGWKNAESEYIAFIADDAEAVPAWLETIVSELDADSHIGVVTGPVPSQCYPVGEMHRLLLFSQKHFLTKLLILPYLKLVMENNVLKPGYYFQSGAYSLGTALPEAINFSRQEVDLATTTNMGTRMSVLKQLHGFDESFNFNHADGDFFLRVKKSGFKIIFNPKITVKHYLRLGPSRNPYFIGLDTGIFYRKDVRPKSLLGLLGAVINVLTLNVYWIYSFLRLKDVKQLKGISGFVTGLFLRS